MTYPYPKYRVVFQMSQKVAMGRFKTRRLFEQYNGGVTIRPWHEAGHRGHGINRQAREVSFCFDSRPDEVGDCVAAYQSLVTYVWYADKYPCLGYEIQDFSSGAVLVQVGIAKK